MAGRTNVRSYRRSQHRDHGASLRSDHCGAVNSIAQKWLEPAVLAHSKCRIKALPKTQCCGGVLYAGAARAILDTQLLKRERPRITGAFNVLSHQRLLYRGGDCLERRIPAAIRPYSMAVAPDSSFTKRAIRFFIGLNSMYTWLVELTSGLTGVLGTATVGATLRSDNCGAVNSIAQKRRNRLFLRTVNVELMHCLKCNIAGSTLSWRRRARATFGFTAP